MFTLEVHRRVVLRDELLQLRRRGGIRGQVAGTIRMHARDVPSKGLLEFGQGAAGPQTQGPIHLQKVSFAGQTGLPLRVAMPLRWRVHGECAGILDTARGYPQ